jgi:ATP-dependent Zn protease
MNRSRRGLRTILLQLATCLALALAVVAATAGAAGAVHYERESFTTFQQQLSAGQIHTATFNKKAHTLHLLLYDGRYVLISYPSHEEPQLAALLRAKGVTVTVEKKKAATKAVHHTLRYIAGGLVLVVVVVVVAVLLVDRRRKLGEAEAGGAADDPPAQSTADSQ